MWSRLAVTVLVVACGGSSKATMIDAPVDVPVRTVTGTMSVNFVAPGGVVAVPLDVTRVPISAWLPPTFAQIPVSASSNGTFSISGVAVGTYILQLGTRYIELTADTVDLSFDLLRRPNAAAATASTPLTFDVTNLATWQATDELQLFSPGSGTAGYALETYATTGAPMVGDTTLALTYDLRTAYDPGLVDASAGDHVTLTQLSTQTSAGLSYRAAAGTFTPTSFTARNGMASTLSGTFTAVAQSATLDMTWNRPAYAAELSAHSPGNAPDNWSTLAVSPLPQAAMRGKYYSAPDVLVFAPGYSTDSSIVTASWAYGDPWPIDWTRVLWNRYFEYKLVQVGSATPLAIFSTLLEFRDLSTVNAQTPLSPIVGAVVSPTVNGKGMFGTLAGVGTMPTVAWTAPTIGTVSRYYVNVYSVSASGGATTSRRIASIETSNTEVVVPPGIITSGGYLFEIGARSNTGIDLSATPSVYGLPEGWCHVISSLATP